MANAISTLLHGNLATIAKYGNGETLQALFICAAGTLDKAAANQKVSDACSCAEAKEYLDALGKTGSAGRDSLSLGTGKIARGAGYKASEGWAWAMRVNKLAKAMAATLDA